MVLLALSWIIILSVSNGSTYRCLTFAGESSQSFSIGFPDGFLCHFYFLWVPHFTISIFKKPCLGRNKRILSITVKPSLRKLEVIASFKTKKPYQAEKLQSNGNKLLKFNYFYKFITLIDTQKSICNWIQLYFKDINRYIFDWKSSARFKGYMVFRSDIVGK